MVLVFGSLFEGGGIVLPSFCGLRWVMGLIFAFGMIFGVGTSLCNDPPSMTQYCPLLAPPNQTSQKVTHLGIALAEARLTAEF
jgi:hypothetical protein